jgi:hypothetical protein
MNSYIGMQTALEIRWPVEDARVAMRDAGEALGAWERRNARRDALHQGVTAWRHTGPWIEGSATVGTAVNVDRVDAAKLVKAALTEHVDHRGCLAGLTGGSV